MHRLTHLLLISSNVPLAQKNIALCKTLHVEKTDIFFFFFASSEDLFRFIQSLQNKT